MLDWKERGYPRLSMLKIPHVSPQKNPQIGPLASLSNIHKENGGKTFGMGAPLITNLICTL